MDTAMIMTDDIRAAHRRGEHSNFPIGNVFCTLCDSIRLAEPEMIYVSAALPMHYVAEDCLGRFWLFPATAKGWDDRREYRGPKLGLTPIDPATDHGVRISTGADYHWITA